jgi:FtsH-binding integral membrane protein
MSEYPIFVRNLLIFLTFLVLVLSVVHSFESQADTILLSVMAVVLFTLLSIGLFIALKISVKSTNKQLFISYTLINMLVRMVVSIVLLLVYREIFKPVDGKFVLPFLVIYVLFTIFETSFMLKIADEKP